MLLIHLSIPIKSSDYPKDDELQQAVFVNKIKDQLVDEFKNNTKIHDDEKMAILESPAFYAINTTFSLSEYVKNSLDAGASKLDICILENQDKTISSFVIDNGSGFPDKFLGKKTNDSPGLTNYLTKLTNENEDEYVASIESSKKRTEEYKTDLYGGRGLGLATITRVLDVGDGKSEIGNVDSLPGEIQDILGLTAKDTGAVIALTSPGYSQELLEKFESDAQGSYFGSQRPSELFLKYLQENFGVKIDLLGEQDFTPSTPSESSDFEESESLFGKTKVGKFNLSLGGPTINTPNVDTPLADTPAGQTTNSSLTIAQGLAGDGAASILKKKDDTINSAPDAPEYQPPNMESPQDMNLDKDATEIKEKVNTTIKVSK